MYETSRFEGLIERAEGAQTLGHLCGNLFIWR